MMNAVDDDIVRIVRRAETVVTSVETDALRPVAFSEVLRFLLAEGAGHQSPAAPSRRTPTKANEQPKKAAGGTASRILALRDEGFFDNPKAIAEIQGELRTRGYFYPVEQLSTPLVRLVRKRLLRRLERRAGGKTVFEYCVP